MAIRMKDFINPNEKTPRFSKVLAAKTRKILEDCIEPEFKEKEGKSKIIRLKTKSVEEDGFVITSNPLKGYIKLADAKKKKWDLYIYWFDEEEEVDRYQLNEYDNINEVIFHGWVVDED